ncbi:hypothetical protein [Mycobacterium malmoense]|uniref:hypothetical protein n=1 Tax=Mycobacterium malmoense TaxID=1780 RepID=UPI00114D4B60|nr:hypothetical protein [Mycobacterium malmoense]
MTAEPICFAFDNSDEKAEFLRLCAERDLMAKQLLGIALTAESESVKLAAIRDALDRGGLKAPSEVVLSQGETKPYETVFDSIGGNPEDAGFPSAANEEDGSAGIDSVPPAMVDPAEEYRKPSSDSEPLRQAERREDDRDNQPQARESHITGMAAIHLASQANRQAGMFGERRAIESPHKRYRRP